MDQNLQKQVRARINELPEDVRKAIMDADLDRRIQTIGSKHHLHVDQIGKLEDETLLVMLAFTDPADFPTALQKQLGVGKEETDSLATDINNEIFMPIRQSMQEYAEEKSLLNTLAEDQTPKAGTLPPSSPPPSTSVAQKTPGALPVTAVPIQKTPATPPTTSATPAKPQVPLAPHPNDLMLVEKTVTTPATPSQTPLAAPAAAEKAEPAPQKPNNYSTDPYREPVEP